MKINARDTPSATILRLDGDFLSEVDQIALRDKVRALVGENKYRVIINLAGVKYINSCGLGSLVCALTTVRKVGGDLYLACVGHEVERILKITALHTVFNIFQTMETAIAEANAYKK
jgi:anti-sigma B factor antagonist